MYAILVENISLLKYALHNDIFLKQWLILKWSKTAVNKLNKLISFFLVLICNNFVETQRCFCVIKMIAHVEETQSLLVTQSAISQ